MKIPQEDIWNPKHNTIDVLTNFSLHFMAPFFTIINCHRFGLDLEIYVAFVLSGVSCMYYSTEVDDDIKKIILYCSWVLGAFFVIISFKWYEYVVYFLPILLWIIKYFKVRHRYK